MVTTPADEGVRAPQNDAPVADVDRMVAERLAENALIVLDGQVIAVVIAVYVADGRLDRTERFGDFGLEFEVAVACDVGNAVAEIDDEIRAGIVGKAGEVGHQVERAVAALGERWGAVMNVGDERDAHGHGQLLGQGEGGSGGRHRTRRK
jgi:hypothetical protein